MRKKLLRKCLLTNKKIRKALVRLYLSADKGNKTGISHFVKYLRYHFKEEGYVKKQLLDVDAFRGGRLMTAQRLQLFL